MVAEHRSGTHLPRPPVFRAAEKNISFAEMFRRRAERLFGRTKEGEALRKHFSADLKILQTCKIDRAACGHCVPGRPKNWRAIDHADAAHSPASASNPDHPDRAFGTASPPLQGGESPDSNSANAVNKLGIRGTLFYLCGEIALQGEKSEDIVSAQCAQ